MREIADSTRSAKEAKHSNEASSHLSSVHSLLVSSKLAGLSEPGVIAIEQSAKRVPTSPSASRSSSSHSVQLKEKESEGSREQVGLTTPRNPGQKKGVTRPDRVRASLSWMSECSVEQWRWHLSSAEGHY